MSKNLELQRYERKLTGRFLKNVASGKNHLAQIDTAIVFILQKSNCKHYISF